MQILSEYRNARLVTAYAAEYHLDLSAAEMHFTALKTFLSFCAHVKAPCVPDKYLDQIWHKFILFTSDYAEFCNAYIGRFVHHNPRLPDEINLEKVGVFLCSLHPENPSKLKVRIGGHYGSDCDNNSCASDCSSSGDCDSG